MSDSESSLLSGKDGGHDGDDDDDSDSDSDSDVSEVFSVTDGFEDVTDRLGDVLDELCEPAGHDPDLDPLEDVGQVC
jgi:hypothetical protein